ncbi:MAG: nagA [Bacillales bacterium]|nr:nagA [Bacillales bacterium]
MPILIINASIYSQESIIENGYIYLEDHKIGQFGLMENLHEYDKADIFDLKHSGFVLPGFIDIHIHGADGADTMDSTEESLKRIAKKITEEGTTSFLTTTMTQSNTLIETALLHVKQYMKDSNPNGEAEVLGIHLEGPFINVKKAGAQPKEFITEPSIERFQKWQTISGGNIRLITIAPEMEGSLELIKYLSSNNVVVSLGHSDASFDEANMAVEAGATHVTHLFNAMSGLDHREPGLAAAALVLDELNVELITDGIHVHPKMIEFAINAKGSDKAILVTDAMCAKGLRDGEYALGGQKVNVNGHEARLADGTLAGSVLLMSEAIRNVIDFTRLPLDEVVKLATANPAKLLGIYERKGSISIGKDADITVIDENFNVILTICRGKIAYLKKDLF